MNKNIKDLREEEVKFVEPPQLKLITGGKGPPTGDGSWLSELELGAVFLGQDDRDHSKWALAMFQKMKVSPNTLAVLLASDVFPEKYMWVNPTRFSKAFRKVDILEVMQPISHQEEQDNDQRPVLVGGVADDATLADVPPYTGEEVSDKAKTPEPT